MASNFWLEAPSLEGNSFVMIRASGILCPSCLAFRQQPLISRPTIAGLLSRRSQITPCGEALLRERRNFNLLRAICRLHYRGGRPMQPGSHLWDGVPAGLGASV